jgi:hypothetical protein
MQARYWQRFEIQDIKALLELIEEVYSLPSGLLRPDDSIDRLTLKVPETRWWRGPVHDVIAGDRQAWLEGEMQRRLRHNGAPKLQRRINTIHELACAWCEFRLPDVRSADTA